MTYYSLNIYLFNCCHYVYVFTDKKKRVAKNRAIPAVLLTDHMYVIF